MRKIYSNDLLKEEWSLIKHLFQVDYSKSGRPLKYFKREVLHAILYILRTGYTWRDLPGNFPSW